MYKTKIRAVSECLVSALWSMLRQKGNCSPTRSLLALMTVAACASTLFAAPLPDGPAPAGKAWEPAWGYWSAAPNAWLPTHMGHVKRIQAGPTGILFLGDSLTKGWEEAGREIWETEFVPLHAVDAGIGGDTTRQVLWRLDNGLLDGVQPKIVILMIGVNNIFANMGTDEEISKGIGAILEKIHDKSPATKILLLGLLPLGNPAQTARVKAINSMIAKFAGPSVRYLDLCDKFQDPQGNLLTEYYSPDKVHLSKTGYQIWGAGMGPVLKEMQNSAALNIRE